MEGSNRKPRSVGMAAFLATTASVLLAASAIAGDYSAPQVIRRAAEGVDLRLGDIASKGNDVAIVWQEQREGGPASLLRLSGNGGVDFDARWRLGSPGSRVRETAVDVCGGTAYAISAISPGPGGAGTWDLGLGYARFDHLDEDLDDSFLAFDHEDKARRPDIACVGDRALAGAWIDAATHPAHIEVLIRGFGTCGESCGEFWDRFSLGRGDVGDGVSIAATNDDVYVVWMRGDDVRFKRFEIGSPGGVTPHPTQTLFSLDETGGRPEIAASGSGVALIYANRNDARARVSDDHGESWGSQVIYVDGPSGPADAFAFPTSVDMRGDRILLEGGYLCCSFPSLIVGYSSYSDDGGETWTVGYHDTINGLQVGALTSAGGGTVIVETWDDRYPFIGEAPAHQKLRSRHQLP